MITAITAEDLIDLAYANNPQVPLPIAPDTVKVSAPIAVTGTYNTNVTVTGLGIPVKDLDNVYTGEATLEYTRVDLAVLLRGLTLVVPVSGIAVNVHAILGNITQVTGLPLSASDVINAPITPGENPTALLLRAAAGSYNYIGEGTIWYVDNGDTGLLLSEAVTQQSLGGFTLAMIAK